MERPPRFPEIDSQALELVKLEHPVNRNHWNYKYDESPDVDDESEYHFQPQNLHIPNLTDNNDFLSQQKNPDTLQRLDLYRPAQNSSW